MAALTYSALTSLDSYIEDAVLKIGPSGRVWRLIVWRPSVEGDLLPPAIDRGGSSPAKTSTLLIAPGITAAEPRFIPS